MNKKRDEIKIMLCQNPVMNSGMLYFIDHYKVDELILVGDTVLLRGESDKKWVYLYAKNQREFESLLPYIKKTDKNFAVIESYMYDKLMEGYELDWELTCDRYYFEMKNQTLLDKWIDKYDSLVFDLPLGHSIAPLTIQQVPYILENYKYSHFTDEDYLTERIQEDLSYGYYVDGELSGWVMTHDDGSIGVLNVINKYKRMGIGSKLVYTITKRKIDLGQLPFMHIEETNTGSVNMAQKLGYIKDRRIHWIGRK